VDGDRFSLVGEFVPFGSKGERERGRAQGRILAGA